MSNIKSTGVFLIVFLFVLLCTSCTSTGPTYVFDGHLPRNHASVLLADPIYLEDLGENAGSDELKLYENNVFVGAIKFSGGIITDPDRHDISRAKIISLFDSQLYRGLVSTSLAQSVEDALMRIKVDGVVRLGTLPAGMIACSARLSIQGDPAWIRKDNMNQPYREYRFRTKLDPDAIGILNQYQSSFLVVPLVECAYSHTSGWFYDQSSGSTAGFRARFHVLVLDPMDGHIMFNFFEDFRRIPGMEKVLSYNAIQVIVAEVSDLFSSHLATALTAAMESK